MLAMTDWPPHTSVTGNIFYDGVSSEGLPRTLEHFLADGPAPVVVDFAD